MNNQIQTTNSTDDMHVLRQLMHTIKGISPVSGSLLGGDMPQEYVLVDVSEQSSQEQSI